jgi:thiol-disulfide isomerase/thioredoxin
MKHIKYLKKSTLIGLLFMVSLTWAQSEGAYTITGSGLDELNGLWVAIDHPHQELIGESYESEKVAVKNGSFQLKGTIKSATGAALMFFQGKDIKRAIRFVLEPETLQVVPGNSENEYTIKGSHYTDILYNNLSNDPKYIKMTKDYRELLSKSLKTKLTEAESKRISELSEEMSEYRHTYLINLYENATDDMQLKVLAAKTLSGIYKRKPEHIAANQIRLNWLLQHAPNHPVVKYMKYLSDWNKDRNKIKGSVDEGKLFKDFTAKDHEGNDVKFSNVLKKNKYVLLEFWASWCGPCRGAIPHLKDNYAKYKSKGFEIVSFSIDGKKYNWDKAYKEESIPWIDVSDLLAMKSTVAKDYGITGVPASFLIDQEGNILGADMRAQILDDKLKEVFGY